MLKMQSQKVQHVQEVATLLQLFCMVDKGTEHGKMCLWHDNDHERVAREVA